MPDLKMKSGGGVISTRVSVLKQHVGGTAVDIWQDTDHNGSPDRFLRRIKQPGQNENQPIVLGEPAQLHEKVIQWIWMPSQPPQATDGWAIEIDVTQDGQSLVGMPMRLAGEYPSGQRYGLFETWFRLIGS